LSIIIVDEKKKWKVIVMKRNIKTVIPPNTQKFQSLSRLIKNEERTGDCLAE
jgi:hypothetical protein